MSSNVKVAVAQINCSVGDFEGNSRKIVEAAARAVAEGADVLVTPELSLTGYPPEDLLLRRAFYAACDSALQRLAVQLLQIPGSRRRGRSSARARGPALQCGLRPAGWRGGRDLLQARPAELRRLRRAALLHAGQSTRSCSKSKGTMFGVNICEDTWFHYAPECAQAAGAQVLLVLNASPFHLGKQAQRLQTMRGNVSHFGLPLVYANLVGRPGRTGVRRRIVRARRRRRRWWRCAPHFDEAVLVVEFVDGVPQPASIVPEPSLEALAYQALVLGVRDYVGKNGFPGALIGPVRRRRFGPDAGDRRGCAGCRPGAGGHDAVAVHRADEPRGCRSDWRRNLGVRHDVLPIKPAFDAFLATLAGEFRGLPWDTTEENLQARIRGTLLMALSNKYGAIVLTTGNKSETAVGYSTLYGDLAGGFAVIKDILKTLVYRLCRASQSVSPPVIPERILTRAPERRAEGRARPTRTRCRPYEVLDAIITRYMEEGAVDRRHRRRWLRRRRGPSGRAHDPDLRVQAPAVAGGHPRDPPQFRPRLALPDHQSIPRREFQPLESGLEPERSSRQESDHETDHRDHQAIQARRGARSARGGAASPASP